MKIRIEFNETEKVAACNSLDIPVSTDRAEKASGKFGNYIYSPKNHFLEINLTECYFLSVSILFGRIVRMVKEIMNLSGAFSKEWVSDIKRKVATDDSETSFKSDDAE